MLNVHGQSFIFTLHNSEFTWGWPEVMDYDGKKFIDCSDMDDEKFTEFVMSLDRPEF